MPNGSASGKIPVTETITPAGSSTSTSSTSQSSSSPGAGTISVEEFFGGATTERKASADTVTDPATGQRSTPAPGPSIAERQPMDESEALKESGKLMAMRETLQAIGLNYLADGEIDKWEQYKYEDWARRLLIEAWAPIIQGLNLRVNKWVQVFYAEAISTGPLVNLALKARKYRLENEQLKAQLYQQQVQQAAREQQAAAQPSNAIPLNPQQPTAWDRMNYDSKRKWEVDDRGFFKEDKNGYIQEGDRREQPLLRPEIYERLCKHNGKERIDKIFKVNAP